MGNYGTESHGSRFGGIAGLPPKCQTMGNHGTESHGSCFRGIAGMPVLYSKGEYYEKA